MQKILKLNPTTCICEGSRYLKSIDNDSVIVCDEFINAMESLSTIVTNTIAINVMTTISINSDNKKVRYKMLLCICYRYIIIFCTRFS